MYNANDVAEALRADVNANAEGGCGALVYGEREAEDEVYVFGAAKLSTHGVFLVTTSDDRRFRVTVTEA